MKQQIYPSINGLRAISICILVISHLDLQLHIFNDFSKITILQPISLLLKDGHLAVNIFFVLSGFLITNFLLNEEMSTNNIKLNRFYFRRILRIFPAYFFLLYVYIFLQFFNQIHLSYLSWISSFTFTKSLNWNLDWETAHLWSLSVEEQFYIFFPLIFLIGKKFRKTLIVSIIFLVPIIRVYVFCNPKIELDCFSLLLRMDAIATGCLIAIYKDKIIAKMSVYWYRYFYAAIFCLVFIRFLDFPILKSRLNLDFILIPFGNSFGTIANFSIAIILMYSVFGPKKLWFKFLNLKIVNFIGILSFSIYLWQQIFIIKSLNWVQQFPQNVFLILIVSMFSYFLIEKPFLRLKSKLREDK